MTTGLMDSIHWAGTDGGVRRAFVYDDWQDRSDGYMPLQFPMRKVLISFLLAVLASVSSLVAPAYTGITVREIPDNRESSSLPQTETPVHPVRHATLAEVNGPGTYFLLVIPVAVAGLPLLLRSRAVRILSAALITGWVLIAATSIGLFYIPSAVMMVWSAFGKSGLSSLPVSGHV